MGHCFACGDPCPLRWSIGRHYLCEACRAIVADIPQSIANLVKAVAERAGLDPEKVFSGHSLRSGFATTAAVKGKTLPKIMRQGRWKDQRTAMMYIRPATVWEDNASDGLGDLVEKKR
jgi:integrase